MASLGSKTLGVLLGHTLGHGAGDELGLMRRPFSRIGGFDSRVMRFNRCLLGRGLGFLSGDLSRIFGGFGCQLGFGLRNLGHLCRLLGQAGGLKGGRFGGTVGSRLCPR